MVLGARSDPKRSIVFSLEVTCLQEDLKTKRCVILTLAFQKNLRNPSPTSRGSSRSQYCTKPMNRTRQRTFYGSLKTKSTTLHYTVHHIGTPPSPQRRKVYISMMFFFLCNHDVAEGVIKHISLIHCDTATPLRFHIYIEETPIVVYGVGSRLGSQHKWRHLVPP